MYYDPWHRRKVTEEVGRRKADEVRLPVPDGHPVGFDFDFGEAGWNRDNPAFTTAHGDDQAIDEGHDSREGWENDNIPDVPQTNGVPNASNAAVNTNVGVPTTNQIPSQPNWQPSVMNPTVYTANQAHPSFFPHMGAPNVVGNRGLDPHLFPYNPYAVSAVRQFLREVGIGEENLTGSWVELRMYMRGRLQR